MVKIHKKTTKEDILIKSTSTKQGGNKMPKRIRFCKVCEKTFTPNRLDHIYCSRSCSFLDRKRTVKHVATKMARKAHSKIQRAIRKGKIIRPSVCEECGETKIIEAAHYDYRYPLKVRWLCSHCHRLWDKKNPKNGTVIKKLTQNKL